MSLIWTILAIAIAWALVSILTKRQRAAKLANSGSRTAVVVALLSLDEEPLGELFGLYRQQFGPGAARYARQTYEKWKSGKVTPNRRTFNRLAVNLPTVMDFDLKCELLRTLRREFCGRDDHVLTVYTDNWKESLAPLVTNIIDRSYTAALPAPLVKQLSWLSADDMTAANTLLAEAQARESRQTLAMLSQDFQAIDHLLAETNGHGKVVHLIELPFGTLTLHIKRRADADARRQ
jgi:hypothetical protein